ncbi:MAG TPA: DNA polymerase I [Rhodothermales bacterium]|nr:DNA polymerase I [Rhodothermales bacterium]
MERLFLLDGMALAYRAHFAFATRPLINKKGMDTSACYGFVGTMLSLIEREKPEHIAVVMDAPGPNFRDEIYEKYKGHRPPMPDPLRIALPFIKDLVKAFDIPMLEIPGYEADDVIGTLAKRAEAEGQHAVIVSPDKDFRQLLGPGVSILRPTRKDEEFDWVTEEKFRTDYGLPPVKFIDVLALLGDTADNVPGVPGIGEKTAPSLIQQYGSVENLLEHAAEITAKRVREGLLNNHDQAIMSKLLVTIHTEVALDLNWQSLVRTKPDMEEIGRLFDELEFGKTLRGRIHRYAKSFQAVPQGPAGSQANLFGGFELPTSGLTDILVHGEEHSFDAEKVQYQLLTDPAMQQALGDRLNRATEICFDTETTGTDAMIAELVGCSTSTQEAEAYYLPTLDATTTKTVLSIFKPALENPAITKCGQNVKYDLLMMKRYGIHFKGPIFDTMVAHFLLSPDGQHGLDAISMEVLNYKKIPTSALLGEGKKNQKTMREVPVQVVSDYACEDADITLRLTQHLRKRLAEEGLLSLAEEVEMPLVPVLAQVEANGILVDVAALKEYSVQLASKLIEMEQQIYESAGGTFNIGSPKQLGEVLFERLKLPSGKKTATGQYSTDERVLQELAVEHDLPALILDWRKFSKLKSTYVDALPTFSNPNTGRVHTSFHQTIAATGRLASSNPNLQNIPIRSGEGREIRRAFIAAPGHVLLSADYSQIELRIIAHMSNDEGLIETFQRNEDVHTDAAARIFKVAPEAVTRLQRNRAKEVNYGIPYGISSFGLSQRMRIPRSEAQFLIDGYHASYPGVARLILTLIEEARKKGYAETLYGRRRYLKDIHSANRQLRQAAERVAVNMPIQGSQADMIKIAMIRLHRRLEQENLKSRMILQVHDELLFEVPENEVQHMKAIVHKEMQEALPLSVPIEIGIGVGPNWLDAH